MPDTLVLAYSGRPEAAREIARLAASTGAEIVTVTVDLGQAEDLEQVCLEARTAGAARTSSTRAIASPPRS